ncbi:GNAT family N-acetyltransferase [Paractinoplanes hotanensis]|uniref:GNAT family N-acetyltransferase n=1 Tax=Paractinoplanes hotanensis TaxID=2906497 RepID=A0ABT0Y8N1_9ACTN|nr:GNAT family N-acetyltransferase [Actinoplanes hotanensis]MCM4082185.1 GNAT family N-acetyltransferase [Actinoplanes hotanensis]
MSHACTRLTDRLRLEPIGARLAGDLFALYQDADVARWYGRWTREQVEQEVARIAQSWLVDGVHKWMAYERVTGECVGRGGLSRTRVEGRERLELGWALHRQFWGRGYATEIGRAGLELAFGELGAQEVASFTEVHNHRSRAVMERLGFEYSKDITVSDEPFALYLLARGADRSPAAGEGV